MNAKFYSYDLELKSLNNSGEFAGYGAVFHNKDCQNDILLPGACRKSLDAWERKNQLPHLLWMHQMTEPIGLFTTVKEDGKGLRVEGRLLVDDDPLAKRAYAHLKNKRLYPRFATINRGLRLLL